MIKTTELMLGNLVELNGIYFTVYKITEKLISMSNDTINCSYIDFPASDINPIPLTEGVLERLGLIPMGHKYVHELQIGWRAVDNQPDYSLLLSPRYTTHDGVEVWEGDEDVWTCVKGGRYSDTNNVCEPKLRSIPLAFNILPKDTYLVFSTQQSCQSYIDSVTRKPIFTTEDGVDVFEGDKCYAVSKTGYYISDPEKKTDVHELLVARDNRKSLLVYFSTPEIAKKYLNRTWLKSDAEKAEKEYQDLLNAKK